MKIEIGESLALSYLKHVKNCVVYQTNWKASNRWSITNEEKLKVIFEAVRKSEEFRDISKKSEFDQFLKQAEIDALGIDQAGKVYAIDIAFHEQGLRYGSTDEETAARVTKKLFRSYLAMRGYFPEKNCDIIFASPRVSGGKDESIKKCIKELTSLLKEEFKKGDIEYQFQYIANDQFKVEILDKTLASSKENADTGELFLRSYKLLNMPYTAPKPVKKKEYIADLDPLEEVEDYLEDEEE